MPPLSEVLVLPPMRWILAMIKLALLLALIWFGVHVGVMVFDGLTDELDKELFKANVAVVMGNEVLPNGKPSPRLKARLDKALELYNNGRIETIIVSGGVDDAGHDEATIMGRYLYRQGVPKDVIMVDSLGDDTFLTAANVKRMLEFHQTRKLMVVVSSYTHIMRARLAMNKCGFKVVYGAHADFFEWRDLWYSIPKEFLAYYYYLNRPCPDAVAF
ncbi:MAG: YdcF family protein [Candidatus Sericytochromatia bacterium]